MLFVLNCSLKSLNHYRMNPKLPSLVIGLCLFFSLFFLSENLSAQTFNPIAVTGFNQDIVAETGTSSLTTTTICADGVGVSNKVLYSVAFRTANGQTGGGR